MLDFAGVSADKERRLSLAEGVDLRALPITPEDAFVLSRVDGSAGEADIALATGLALHAVRASLAKLAGLGAIREDIVTGQVSRPAQTTSTSGTFHIGPIVETRGAPSGQHPAASLYDPAELDEPVDLELARKRQILDAFYSLDRLSHYELLGVEAKAEKKAIKTAYFELVNHFHPDRYFGKNLGSFKGKLEKLFTRVTEAHDVLTRGVAREEYDRYLASVRQTQALDQTLADKRSHTSEVERVEREIQQQIQLEEKARSSRPPPLPPSPAPPPQSDPSSAPRPVPTTSSAPPLTRPGDAEARRRALARKLGISIPPASRASPAPAPAPAPSSTPSPSAREAAAADLKRRYEERVAELRQRQVRRYLDAASEAEARRDLVSATNALRIAVSLNPEDKSLEARLRDTETRAANGLADSYLEQAQYEEREGRWLEAAASYRRASRGKPSPRVFERTAHCLLNGKGDLKEAADFAKRARDALPDDPYIRLTLGKIYNEAGMKQSAIAELERAQQLAPKDDTIKDWLRRVRRSEA
ncbi:MAG TPA: DnaJ domain-containing protein [Polyangiaceae bacterium]